MLEILGKSKIRKKILLLFAYNPRQRYYINEIARLVSTSSGTARRELEMLLSADILVRENEANLMYYRLKRPNPLVKNIISIVKQTLGIEVLLKKCLEKFAKIEFAFIFGSYAKQDFKSDSDIDLYIIGDISEKELHHEITVLENEINHPVNYHLSDLGEFKQQAKKSFFHKSIMEEYILLIGNQDEFKNIAK